jgi:acetoacetyl-CoA reductase
MTRTVLVTGGTRGIGKAISIAFKNRGYKVAANYATNDEAAQAFANETGIAVYKGDVSSYERTEEMIRKIESELGAIEILVNNAGITRDAPLHKMQKNQWDDVISTNLTSAFNLSHVLINGMRDRGFGRIVNISSINGLLGQFGQTNYSAAKAGIIGMTKALAREAASKGITVNAVAPGYIDTEMVRAVKPEVMEKIVSAIPVGRLGKAEEVARCVLFLASDNAGFITGETISVNGGQLMD